MKKIRMCCVLFTFLLCVFGIDAAAQEQTTIPDELRIQYNDFSASIPEEVKELLPESFLTSSLEDAEEALRQGGSMQAVLRAAGKLTGIELGESLALFAEICGLLLLAAVFRALTSEKSGEARRAYSFCTTLAMAVLLLGLQREKFESLERFFSTLQTLCASILPMMGTLFAMGGEVRRAVANHSALSFFLAVLETLCAGTVLPIAGICLAFSLLDAITGRARLRGLAGVIKRTYTLMIAFLMGIFCFVLGTQSTLAKAADSLAIRTVKFAAGSFLPLVGGSVSETLRTVVGSVSYLRTVTGTGVILVLFFAFLPTFLSTLLTRITFLLGGAVANMLSCEAESKLLTELASVFGYFLAIISVLFVALIFSLTLFAQCATVV